MAQQIVIEVPGTKISELERASSVSRTDVTPVVQNDETKQAEIGQIADFVKSELGSAASKDASEFATPSTVTAVAQASQQRDDAQNERIDDVEFKITLAQSGVEASFDSYAAMLAYTPSKANVSVRVNNDPDNTKVGTYTWTGSEYKKGFDLAQYLLNIVNALATVKPKKLPNSTDFNLITEAGNHYIGSHQEAETMLNLPSSYQLSGTLINIPLSVIVKNGILMYAYQCYRTGLGTAIERYCVNHVWRDWSVVADKKAWQIYKDLR